MKDKLDKVVEDLRNGVQTEHYAVEVRLQRLESQLAYYKSRMTIEADRAKTLQEDLNQLKSEVEEVMTRVLQVVQELLKRQDFGATH